MTSVMTAWEPGRRFMLRVAGLPAESVHALRCPGSVGWAERVLAEEDRLRERAAELSDVLYGLVTTTDTAVRGEGDQRRRRLLSLRREIFNNRLPADPDAAARFIAELDGDAGRQVGEWLDGRRRFEQLRAEGEDLLLSDVDRSRTALRELVGEERLRRGLLLASPTLAGQLEGYLRKPVTGARPDKRTRKVERSLLSYLYRTACKTSPFSTFTGVATGIFSGGSAAGAEREDGDAAVRLPEVWESRARLNVLVLGRLAELVLADPARRADLPVRLASGWGRDEDRVRYVRRWVTAGDDEAAVTFDAVKDRLFFLRRSGILDRLLALFEGRAELRYRELAEWLSNEHDAPPEQCETYLGALLQLGMIRVPCLETDVHSPDPLRSFQEALRTLGRPWAERIADGLDATADAVAAFPEADASRRPGILRELREGLHALQRQLGAQEPSLPQTVLYEDTAAGEDLECRWPAWEGQVAEDLQALEGALPAFDLTLPQRITFKGFFLARYGRGGRCEDLLGLVHDFHEDFFDQYLSFTAKRRAFDDRGEYVPEENWLGLPGIKAVDSARRVFVDRMRKLWAEAGSASELVLQRAHLEETAAELAPVAADFAPQSHHLQIAAAEEADPLAVVNRSYGGLAFPFSRFTHLYDAPRGRSAPADSAPGLSEALRETAARVTPPGAVLAEVTGGPVASNLNLHGRLTDYEIVCPGETSTVPEEARLHLDDLYVEHDEDADRLLLRSRRLDREVVPVYLGYLVPLALPEISRTLLLLSPSSMSRTDVWGGVPEAEPHEGVTTRPRVRYGSLVLSRRSWTTTAGRLPVRQQPGVSDAEWFLGWQRWRRQHSLPARVFATVSGSADGRGGAGAKPSCVDFDSPLSLTAFEALVRDGADRIVLREMLPTEDGLHVRSARGGHVAELAVETFTLRRPAKEVP